MSDMFFGHNSFFRSLIAVFVVAGAFALPAFRQEADSGDVEIVLPAEDSLAGRKIEAGQVIAVGPMSITIAGNDGEELGTLLPGTPLKALANNSDRIRIEIKGWSLVDYRTLVTSGLGERLAFARLNERGQAARKVLGKTVDPYEMTWEEVQLPGWVAKAGIAKSAAVVWTLAGELFQDTCNACHVAPAPDTYTANQWPGLISNMVLNAGLMGNELVLVRQYLQTHAKDPWATDDVSEDEQD